MSFSELAAVKGRDRLEFGRSALVPVEVSTNERGRAAFFGAENRMRVFDP